MSALTSPPRGAITSTIQWNTAVPAGEREPGEQRAAGAADAEGDREREPEQPDERRRGRVVELEAEQAEQHAADARRSRPTGRRSGSWCRLTAMPDASAATSELRTARIARPDGERWSAWMTSVSTPKIDEEQQDLLRELAEVDLRQVRDRAGSTQLVDEEVVDQFSPGCRASVRGSSSPARRCR